ncbi:hypothetical protein KCU87_g204, partial [Aureobasidium melanogenum]
MVLISIRQLVPYLMNAGCRLWSQRNMHLVSRVRKRTLHLHVLQKVCRHCKNFVLMRPSVVLQPQAQMTRNSATLISSTCAGTAHVAWNGGLLGQSLAASFPSSLCILLPMPSTLFVREPPPSNSSGGKPSALEIALP